MTDKDIKYWVGFSIIPGIGRVKFSQLENYFSKLEDAWVADAGALKRAGLDGNSVNAIASWRPRINLDEEIEKMYRYGVKALKYTDPDYPSRLKEIYDYPPLLYVKGTLLPEDEWCLAVVGTRQATVYGRQVAEEITADLSRSNITIVSGLAKGIDSAAHQSALAAGGRTVSVFACGLDTVYPSENTDLARNIIQHGALVSEYPLGTKPKPEHFPRHNRIMSGMSLGVLVIEANESNGAITTARFALGEVFAIPDSILSPPSQGTNGLIQEGAKLVRNYTDILEELNMITVVHQIEMKKIIPSSNTETQLLKQLTTEPTHIDEICRNTGLPAATVSSTLTMMELKGMAKQMGIISYILTREARQEYRVQVD